MDIMQFFQNKSPISMPGTEEKALKRNVYVIFMFIFVMWIWVCFSSRNEPFITAFTLSATFEIPVEVCSTDSSFGNRDITIPKSTDENDTLHVIKYQYEISNDKYDARITLFKYLIGIYTALLAASFIGFEKAKNITKHEITIESIINLKKFIIRIILAIIQSILVLAMSYHHKYYNIVYLKQHLDHYYKMNDTWIRSCMGLFVWLEHLFAAIETVFVILLAVTWFILPIIGLYYLAKAYNTVFPSNES
ncbi:hypothetical protein ACFL47_07180 [Candidatus Latescibacterota bacterium]